MKKKFFFLIALIQFYIKNKIHFFISLRPSTNYEINQLKTITQKHKNKKLHLMSQNNKRMK